MVKENSEMNIKEICKRMRKAYKGSGYELTIQEHQVGISTGFFLAVIPMKVLPREILGVIVEHTGEMLVEGIFQVCADGASTKLESVMDTMQGYNLGETLKRTMLTVGDYMILQGVESDKIYGIDLDRVSLLEKSLNIHLVGEKYICCELEDGHTIYLPAKDEKDDTKYLNLQAFVWYEE